MIAKSLEAAIVVLFIGVLSTGLYAGVVPDYRSATAAEVGERTLVAGGNEVEAAIPPNAESVAVERQLELPATIRSAEYRLVAAERGGENATTGAAGSGGADAMNEPGGASGSSDPGASIRTFVLELQHPHPDIGGSRSLALPASVIDVRGQVTGGDARVVVEGSTEVTGLVVRLEDGR